MDLADLEVNGWSGWAVCGGGAAGRILTMVSLPPMAERRTKGSSSRVMVIGKGVGSDGRVGEGTRAGRLGKPIQRVRLFYRDNRLDPD